MTLCINDLLLFGLTFLLFSETLMDILSNEIVSVLEFKHLTDCSPYIVFDHVFYLFYAILVYFVLFYIFFPREKDGIEKIHECFKPKKGF